MSSHRCNAPKAGLDEPAQRHWECECGKRYLCVRHLRSRRPRWIWKQIPAGSSLNEHFDAAVSSSLRQRVRIDPLLGVPRAVRDNPKSFRLAQAPATIPPGFYLTTAESDLLQRAADRLGQGNLEFDEDAAEILAGVFHSVANNRESSVVASWMTRLAQHFAPDHDPGCDSDTCAPDCGVAKAKREDS